MYLSKLICCNSGVNQLFTRMGIHEVPEVLEFLEVHRVSRVSKIISVSGLNFENIYYISVNLETKHIVIL